MIPVTLLKAQIAPGSRMPAQGGARLQPGDRLMAKVLEIGKNGNVRLDLGRFTATALLDTPVRTGMHLPLEVVENAGQLLLKIRVHKKREEQRAQRHRPDDLRGMDEGALRRQLSTSLGRVRGVALWASLPTARKGVALLLRRLRPLHPLEMPAAHVATRLREMVEDSGLFLENRLARHLQSARPQPGHPFQALSGPWRRPALAFARGDSKAVLLQILSDLDQAPRPLPPALAQVEKSADGLLAAIQRQQRRVLAHRNDPGARIGRPLVYGPGPDAAGNAGPAPMHEPPGTAQRISTAWRRVTGKALPASANGFSRGIGTLRLPETVTGRRNQLTLIENRALADIDATSKKQSTAVRDGQALATLIRGYTRDARGRHDGAPHTLKSWHRLERIAAALSNPIRGRRPVSDPIRRLRRLTAALARMIREERLRFDTDLRLLRHVTQKAPLADPSAAPGSPGPSTAGEGDPMFTVTIPMADPHPDARLHVHCPPRRRDGGPAGHQVAIMLSLVPMGDVRAAVHLSPEGLQVSLAVSTDAALQLVDLHRSELASALAGLSSSLRLDTQRVHGQWDPCDAPKPGRRYVSDGKVDIDA